MLRTTERQVLDGVAEQLTREDPDLARMLTPGLPLVPPVRGAPWLSLLLLLLLLLPWAGLLLAVQPVASAVLVAVPVVLGLVLLSRALGQAVGRWRHLRRPTTSPAW